MIIIESRYSGLCCPVCKVKFKDDDDIVVCPVCGAPHHRECYNQIRHCAYEQFHGTESQWREPPKPVEPEQNEESKETQNQKGFPPFGNFGQNPYNGNPYDQNPYNQNPYGQSPYNQGPYKSGPNGTTIGRICPQCRNIVTPVNNTCPNCGYIFPPVYSNEHGNDTQKFDPFGQGTFNGYNRFDPLGGVEPQTDIDGEKAQTVALTVTVNTQRYIPKFTGLKNCGKNRTDWNWAAFFLGPYWFFYRKCYIAGTLSATLSLICGLMMSLLDDTLIKISSSASTINYYELGEQILKNAPLKFIVVFAIGAGLTLISRILFGLFGDYIYKKKCLSIIKDARAAESEDFPLELRKRGGVNIFAPVALWCAVSFLSPLLSTLI